MISKIVSRSAAHLLKFPIFALLVASNVNANPNLSDYELVFNDEFNGSALDASKWNTGFLWGPYLPINNERQFYVDTLGIHTNYLVENGGQTPNPFELTGGTLKIHALPLVDSIGEMQYQVPARPPREDTTWDNFPEYRYNEAFNSGDFEYLSGIITSNDSFRFTHGYTEARIRLPDAVGVWPAFWLLNSFYVEDVPEIDIVEYLGGDPDTIYHTYHRFDPLNNWAKTSTPSFETSVDELASKWLTVGAAWDSNSITWYVDGVETYRITSDDYHIPNQAMYALANLAVGGNWPELLGYIPSVDHFPATYEIDYIRVYQKKPPDIINPEILEQDYALVFSDEFSGNTLDTAKWNTSYLWGPYYQINNENQFYPDISGVHRDFQPNPINISDGTLKLTAYYIDQANLPEKPEESDLQFEANRSWQFNDRYNNPQHANAFLPDYVSGLITSYDSFKFVNGYAEIRAKLPEGSGLWPAFTLPNGYYVDQQPVIDTMEFRGELPGEVVHSYHYSTTISRESPVDEVATTFPGQQGFANDEFHTFGVAWHPGKIDWYVNGEKVHTYASESVSSQLAYATLNLAVDGNFNISTADPSQFPKTFEVDYIRIYQLSSTLDTLSPIKNAAVIKPQNEAVLNDQNLALEWDPADTIATKWGFWIGSSPGAKDYGNIILNNSDTTYTVSELPTDGSMVYVRFWKYNNQWQPIADYQYRSHTSEANTMTSPEITSPELGDVLTSENLTLEWNSPDESPALWGFWIGSTTGARDLDNVRVNGNKTSHTIRNLPADGSMIYVRFWKKENTWQSIADYQYQTYTSQPNQTMYPAITQPVNNALLNSQSLTLEWDPAGESPDLWGFWVGSTPGARDAGTIRVTGSKTSHTISDLPVQGSTVYVRFWKKSNTWQAIADYQYLVE